MPVVTASFRLNHAAVRRISLARRRNAGGRNGSASSPDRKGKSEVKTHQNGRWVLTEIPPRVWICPQRRRENDTNTHRPAAEYSRAYAPTAGPRRSGTFTQTQTDSRRQPRGCICCCCARRRPGDSSAPRNDVRGWAADGADDTGTRERRADGAGHAGRAQAQRAASREREGAARRWWWGLPRLCGPLPVAHALRRPKAARWMRAACALRRGRATERWRGWGRDVWMAGSWRAVWSRRMRCVALLPWPA